MSSMMISYVVKLISDIGTKSRSEAKQFAEAQRLMVTSSRELDTELLRIGETAGKTGTKVGALDIDLTRLGQNTGSQRQKKHMDDLGKSLDTNITKLHTFRAAMAAGLDKIPQYMGAAGAALYAVDRATSKPMDYSYTLARMANTAFADRDVAGRIRGKKLLEQSVTSAVRFGGGTLEGGASALDAMVASGALDSVDQAVKLMPTVMKASTASGATPQGIAMIGVRAMQSGKVALDQVPEAINAAMKGGAAGGFELKDMERWLPNALAIGGQSGLSGMDGFKRIVASMQASATTAGSKDEAGNNVVNLLGKITSQDTNKDFAKLGFDLPSELAKGRKNGVSSIDVVVGLVEKLAQGDKQYMALKSKLGNSKSKSERDAVTEDMAAILQSKSTGKMFQDRQALMALIAELNQKEYVRDVLKKMNSPLSEIDSSYGVVSQETQFKKDAAAQELAISSNAAFEKVAPVFNSIFDAGTEVARQFPLLTAAAVASTTALGVFAAALSGFDLITLLRGGKLPASSAVPGTVGTAGGVAGAKVLAKGFGLRGLGILGAIGTELFMTSDRDMEVLRNADQMRHSRGRGFADPRRLDISSAPKPDDLTSFDLGMRQSIGEGVLRLDVRIQNDGSVSTSMATLQPMQLLRVEGGSTDPGSFASISGGGR